MNNLDAIFGRLAEQRASRAQDPSRSKAAALLARCFPKQRAFIEDPSKRKMLLCPSRAGKSFSIAVYLLLLLLTVPRANLLYVTYIRTAAQEILWDLLKRLNEEHQLNLHFGEAQLTVTNRRGSWLRLAGCESWGDVDKFRGVPRHLVVLDETATWNPAMVNDLVHKVIEPRLGDYGGTLVLAGTPGEILNGLFYSATGPKAFDVEATDEGEYRAMSRPFLERDEEKWKAVGFAWSFHSWRKFENTSDEGKRAWAEALELKKRNGWKDDNPIWLREHDPGKWIGDDSKLVTNYDSARDSWEPGARSPENPFGLPEGHAWRFVLCADMGFHDPFALQVGAFSDTHPTLFQVYEREERGLTVSGVAAEFEKVYALIDREDIEAQAADLQGLGGMVVETLAAEHEIYLDKLEQKDKRDHVELLKAGFHDERIKVMRRSQLESECGSLAWDATGLKMRSNQSNHNLDAFLGVVRHSRHLEAVQPEEKPEAGTDAYLAMRENDEEERIATREKKRRSHNNDGLNDEQDWID